MSLLRTLLAAAEAQFPLHSSEERDALVGQLWNQRSYLLSALRYRIRDVQLCEDILQETFISALRAMDRPRNFADEKALRNYLLTIAYNKVRDHARARYRAEQREMVFTTPEAFDLWIENLGDDRSTPEKQVLDAEAQATTEEAVRLAMASLPDQQRHILQERFTREKPVAQIATEMGIGFKAAESLLFRARKSFQKIFSEILTSANEPALSGVDTERGKGR